MKGYKQSVRPFEFAQRASILYGNVHVNLVQETQIYGSGREAKRGGSSSVPCIQMPPLPIIILEIPEENNNGSQ